MGDPITQDQRLLAVITNAGKDALLLDTVSGQEGISQPYRFVLTMMSEVATGNPSKVIPHQLVGTSISISVELSEAGIGIQTATRYITGLCERFVQEDADDTFAYFSAVIVPFFSFLNYATNCRIFQGKSVPEIVQAVVGQHGYASHLRLETTKSYTARDYCVQYHETDFNFLSRLMESEGIYYYFEHTNGNHVMVLADAPSQYHANPLKSDFKYSPVTGLETTEDTIRAWRVEEEMHPGKWTYRDYHHEAPTNRFEITNPSVNVAAEGTKFEVFDYPGNYAKPFNKQGQVGKVHPEGDKLTRLRVEKEETFQTLISGNSVCRALTSGYKIDVTGGSAAGSYLLTELRHDMNQAPAYPHMASTRAPYRNSFRAIPAATLFVPPADHPRGQAHGLQTAFVIDESESGNTEEIWPDKFGRVRVRFHWDREAKYACWLRVVQPWAGKAWGQQWIPRVGDEVAVNFLEGDPDCPVVIGSIYNADNMPPFSLPGNKTQSGILTHSSKGGGGSNYNMLRFEDKMGSEEIYVQAEKDWNSLIKHDETRTIKHNRTSTIHVNETRTVETGDDTISVEQGKRTITVAQNISTTSNQGDISWEAKKGGISTKADMGSISTKADMGNIDTEASLGSITIKAGAQSVTISGTTGVTISCGASSISMTPSSISISSPMVLINS